MSAPITPALLGAEIIRQASLYANLYEKRPNAEWDDPRTPEPERALNAQLIAVMQEAGWEAPWAYCAGFAEGMVILALRRLGYQSAQYSRVRKLITPHVMTTVRNLAGADALSAAPVPGCLWLARHGSTDKGHAGIAVNVRGGGTMTTIEGNTSSTYQGPEKDRQGDGIFYRERNWGSNGNLKTMGFLTPDAILRLLTQ